MVSTFRRACAEIINYSKVKNPGDLAKMLHDVSFVLALTSPMDDNGVDACTGSDSKSCDSEGPNTSEIESDSSEDGSSDVQKAGFIAGVITPC